MNTIYCYLCRTTQKSNRKLLYLIVITLILSGCFLRSWRIGEMNIFADEIHTLGCAISKDFSWILTHFTASDSCIPLTFYNKLLLKAELLNEYSMRLPSLISGCLLVALMGTSLYILSPLETILTMGIISFSPYFIYLSREARPYSVISFTFTLSVILIFLWAKGKDKRYLFFSAFLCSLSLYFQPVVAPAIALLVLYPLFIIYYKKFSKNKLNEYIFFVLIFTGCSLVFLGPALPSFIQEFGNKGSRGQANFETIQNGMMLLLGLPIIIPLWAWGTAIVIGTISLYRRYPAEILCIASIFTIQILALFLIQPVGMEIPWVWFRYLAHLHSFLIIFIACGIAYIFKYLITEYSKLYIYLISVGACIFFFVWHITCNSYSINKFDSYNKHPIILFMEKDFYNSDLHELISPFYYKTLKDLPEGDLIEAPMLIIFPLYEIYQHLHGRKFYSGTLGNGMWQSIFDNQTNNNLKTIVPLNKFYPSNNASARYLIIHKRIKEEIKNMFKILKQNPFMWTQIEKIDYMFTDDTLDKIFGSGELSIQNMKWVPNNIIYEDRFIAVYELSL